MRDRVSRRTVALLVGWLVANVTAGDELTNGSFEAGEAGAAPAGWFVPTAGYAAELVDVDARQGKLCARLSGKAGQSPFGNLMQSFDAGPFREKRVRLRAAVRVESDGGGRAQMWLREDRGEGQMGFFDNMGDRPITDRAWKHYEIVGNISKDASRLNVGVMVLGGATAWIDDVTIEVLGAAKAAVVEPARPLSDRGLANLAAFTRLLGYVRFFHASDESAATDWDAFAINGVRKVEGADDAEALANSLRELFGPIAPGLAIYSLAHKPKADAAVPKAEAGALKVTQWVHNGVGLSKSMPLYRSTRATRAFDENAARSAEELDPREPLELELGGGVGCLLPVAVFADDKGTLPRGAKPAPPDDGATYSGNDRATRLGDVALAWTVMQHFYPYFDVVETDWPKALERALRAAATDADELAFQQTLRRLIAALHDGHGGVYGVQENLGLLPVTWTWAESKLVITAATEDATKVSSSLTRGTVVAKIDGKPAGEALAAAEEFISGATPQWKRWQALQRIQSGTHGSKAKLELIAVDGARSEVDLAYGAFSASLREKRPENFSEVAAGVYYIDVSTVEVGGMAAHSEALAKAKGVILDMRGYPGTGEAFQTLCWVTDEPIQSQEWHVPRVVRPDRVEMRFDKSGWPVGAKKPRVGGKVAFLTDGRAISAAETYMGFVEHYKLGEIVGAATAGTNGNVNSLALPGGYRVSFTGMKVLKQDGSRHHGVGIQATVAAAATVKGIAEGCDEVLEKAIEVVTK